MRNLIILSALTLAAVTPAVNAIDHSNLDENRPLRMEDPYPIANGEWALETGLGYSVERRGDDRGFFPVEILYGAYPGLQLSVGTELFTDPRSIDDQQKSGDLRLGALYNFNQETLWTPAFGLRTTVNLPTGVRSRGADVAVKGLVAKSFGRLNFNLNGGYEFFNGTRSGERAGIYEFTFGAAYPIGAPKYTRTTLLAAVFTHQSERKGASNIYGVEAGFRHQMTQRVVLDFGVGSELAGPARRAPFYVTTGFSYAF